MTEETREFLEKTLVFQHGDQTVIWGIPLNTLHIDAHELDEYLASGWHAHPFDVRDEQERLAQEAAEEAERLAEAARLKADKDAAEKKRVEDEAEEEARLKRQADEAAKADNELKEKLVAEAETLGLKIDKRWGTKTIQEAIDEAKKAK